MLALNIHINSSFGGGKEQEPQPLVFKLEEIDIKPDPKRKNFLSFWNKSKENDKKKFSHELLGGSVEVIDSDSDQVRLNLHVLNDFEWWLGDTKDTSLNSLILKQTAYRLLAHKPVGDLSKEVILYDYFLPINRPFEFNVMKGSKDHYTRVSSVSVIPSKK